MQIDERDSMILKKIIKYCDDIKKTNEVFDPSEEELRANSVYMNALAMCVLQIGELVTHISDEFKEKNPEIPWKDIRNMRNIAAHNYGDFSARYLWQTIEADIPALRSFCEQRVIDIQP